MAYDEKLAERVSKISTLQSSFGGGKENDGRSYVYGKWKMCVVLLMMN
jgi:phage gp37-like protein